MVFVIANPQQDFFAKPKCEPATSHSCGVVEAISLQVSCHCEPQRGEAISLQVANRSPHCVHDDNLFLHLPATCHCEPQRGEAISLQATLVFGLLRYARNDKNQDGREAKTLSR